VAGAFGQFEAGDIYMRPLPPECKAAVEWVRVKLGVSAEDYKNSKLD
jgi:hypothetical protein